MAWGIWVTVDKAWERRQDPVAGFAHSHTLTHNSIVDDVHDYNHDMGLFFNIFAAVFCSIGPYSADMRRIA